MRLIDKNFKSEIQYDHLNNLELRSDIENDNIGFSENYTSTFSFEGYVGNRPEDFIEDEHEDDTWAIDLQQDGFTVESYLYSSKYEYLQDLSLLTTDKVKEFYTLDKVCTGNHKADHINSRILEWASDTAELLTEKDCIRYNVKCYKIEMEGTTEVTSYTEEAQDIFNEYYDKEVDSLYSLINNCIEIHES